MKRFNKFLLVSTLALLLAFRAEAKAFTKATIIQNHRNCLRFLKLPKAQQAPIARKLRVTTQTLVNSCRSTTRMGVEQTWVYEKMYQNYHRRGGAGTSESREASRPYESSPSTAGTCYDLSDCFGSSVHVSSKSSCPGGYGAFKPDSGGGACERR
ncbi:MAG: hypothetical protein EOP11_26665 [Proteobacteria bacterium]|nr:MAG: hypothetical protein EOP11_26665 [Pseudomonadota bacterium]